jgi:hypothetical protein
MRNAAIFVVGYFMLCATTLAQDQPRQLRGGGHALGETAEQFFTEGFIGELLRVCQAEDWKSVRDLTKGVVQFSKKNAKDLCAMETLTRQQAASGGRLEYRGGGDTATMREDTFTFDGGYLVKIEMVYRAPIAKFEGYQPKSFGDLLEGLQAAYGAPTKAYTERVLDAYGVQYDAHHAVWVGKNDVISIIEHPGKNGWTKLFAATLAEYNRAKTTNPLQ